MEYLVTASYFSTPLLPTPPISSKIKTKNPKGGHTPMYTIGQVSEMFNLPISTLRYYDKEGFFPNLKRESGIRKFTDNELEALRMIECLKASMQS